MNNILVCLSTIINSFLFIFDYFLNHFRGLLKTRTLPVIGIVLFTSFLHTNSIQKTIHIPNNSKILNLIFRYIDMSGNLKIQKLKINATIESNGILFSQEKIKQENYFMEISTKNISKITSLVIEYQDSKGHKFFKPNYYNNAILKVNAPLYAYYNNKNTDKYAKEQSSNAMNMPILSNTQDNNIIDGFVLKNDNFNMKNMEEEKSKLKITKAIDMSKYDFNYINSIIHDIYVDNMNVSKYEKIFCIIPIRDTISYFIGSNKKDLFLVFKDFELSSDLIVNNKKLIIKFPSENRFKTCLKTNISPHIKQLEAFHKHNDGGEVNIVLQTNKDIKSASVVYPKDDKSISSFDKELKDVLIYKIEIN